jgi:hypothetical protein
MSDKVQSIDLTVRVIQALEAYTVTRKEHDTQRDESSYGWGYYGQDIRNKLEREEKSVHDALTDLIRSVVAEMGK